jgi:TonB family protein
MRRILAATALLAPLAFTAAAFASQPATDVAAPAPVRQVSAGVKPAHILSTVNVHLAPSPDVNITTQSEVVLALHVDTAGKPYDIKVVKSPNIALNEPVMDAVRQFHFEPGTVNNQVVAMPVTLTVQLQR